MAEAEETVEASSEEAPKKKSKMGLIIGVVLALVLGGGGFYAVYSGMILGPSTSGDTASDSSGHGESTGHGTTTEEGGHAAATEHGANGGTTNAGFVSLEPLVVSLKGGSSQHLRFRGELEVEIGMEEEVSHLIPRVMDVLNSYLRAVSITDLEDPTTLVTLRAQMLRRIQLVVGAGKVHDLLIMEFVLS